MSVTFSPAGLEQLESNAQRCCAAKLLDQYVLNVEHISLCIFLMHMTFLEQIVFSFEVSWVHISNILAYILDSLLS